MMSRKSWISIVLVVAASGTALGFWLKSRIVRGYQPASLPSYNVKLGHRANCEREPSAPPSQTQYLARHGAARAEAWVDNATNDTSRQIRIARGKHGDFVIISDTDQAKSTFLDVMGGAETAALDPATCLNQAEGYRFVRREPVLGYEAIALEREEKGALRMEIWRLPQAACTIAKMRRYEMKAGNWTLVSAADPLEITLGPPPDWLIAVPANYAEESPSALAVRKARRLSASAGFAPQDPRTVAAVERASKSSPQQDEAYKLNRQQHTAQ